MFHLDHLGTEIGQDLPAQRTSEDAGQVKHAHAVERQFGVLGWFNGLLHGLSPASAIHACRDVAIICLWLIGHSCPHK
jgi:hypothetical protein